MNCQDLCHSNMFTGETCGGLFKCMINPIQMMMWVKIDGKILAPSTIERKFTERSSKNEEVH